MTRLCTQIRRCFTAQPAARGCSSVLRGAVGRIRARRHNGQDDQGVSQPNAGSGRVAIEKGLSRPGDMLILRAELDIVGAASACPMDFTPAGLKGITEVEI